MFYVDEFGRESPEREDYKNTSFYLDEKSLLRRKLIKN